MKKTLLLLISVWTIFFLSAQTTLPYFCGFETEDENAPWQLNEGATERFDNLWHIGTAVKRSGTQAMYISADQGTTAGYTASRNTLTASRTFDIPQGTYRLAFDWRAMGTADSTALLFVCWMPDNVAERYVASSLSSAPAAWITSNMQECSGTYKLWGAASWRHERITVQTNGRPYRLVFVWVNGMSKPVNPGACIDNVQLTTVACEPPENLDAKTDGSSITFAWTGTSNSYSMKYNKYGEDTWATIANITDTQYKVENLDNGIYSFWVQANCDKDTSLWSESPYYLLYDKTAVTSCINYIDLENATCYIGNFTNPYAVKQLTDNGFGEKSSRHTIHYMPDEYDPRTDGMLKTVPDGVLASVRLGNWDTGKQAEAIEYNYYVEPDMNGVLLLKYAVVLENPGHDADEQPRFKLEILQEDGTPVDEVCAAADFTASTKLLDEGWKKVGSNDDIVWKDWTTVGVNLQPYEGQNLTVRLTTYDCLQTGHYGYAYFTLDCAEGAITGISCGGLPTERFKAPDGFFYRWYKPGAPDVTLGTGQEYPTPPAELAVGDTTTYCVDVIYPEAEQCSFRLMASARRRDPVAEVGYELYPNRNCRNEVRFVNNSFILLQGAPTDMRCQSMFWSFGDAANTTSTSYAPSFVYPDEGGTFTVSATAFISDGQCDSTVTFSITLPPIGDTHDTIEVNTCKDYYDFYGEKLVQDGLYTKRYTSLAGCDSTVTVDLHFVEAIHSEVFDTICHGETYAFGTDALNTTGNYEQTFTNDNGCDSIVLLHLYVQPELQVEIHRVEAYCGETGYMEIPYNLNGDAESYSLICSDMAVEAGLSEVHDAPLEQPLLVEMPLGIEPGIYPVRLVFMQASCGSDTVNLDLTVNYPASIIVQRWNDVLALRNARYNGGYDFAGAGFQWYKDGTAIAGQNGSVLYQEGVLLEPDSEYHVEVHWPDGTRLFSCSLNPQRLSDNTTQLENNWLRAGQEAEVRNSSPVQVRVLDMQGRIHGRYALEAGNNTFTLPEKSGMYIIEFTQQDGRQMVEKIIVE